VTTISRNTNKQLLYSDVESVSADGPSALTKITYKIMGKGGDRTEGKRARMAAAFLVYGVQTQRPVTTAPVFKVYPFTCG